MIALINDATDVHGLFKNCAKLPLSTLLYQTDTQRWTFPKSTDFSELYYGCNTQFDNLLLSFDYGTDATTITSTQGMFAKTGFYSLTIGNKLKSSRNKSYMFQGCSKLTQINTDSENTFDLSTFTMNQANISYMFDGCSKVEEIILPNTQFIATGIERLFSSCQKLTTITNFDKLVFRPEGNSGSMKGTFNYCMVLPKLIFSPSFVTEDIIISDFSDTFANCYKLSIIDSTDGPQTENVLNLKNIGLSFKDTMSCQNTFCNCYLIKEIVFMDIDQPLSKKHPERLFNCQYMFSSCKGLQKLTNFEKIHTTDFTDMRYMFANSVIFANSGILALDLSSFIANTERGGGYYDEYDFDDTFHEDMRHLKFPSFNATGVKMSLRDTFGSKLMKLDISNIAFSTGYITSTSASGYIISKNSKWIQEIDVMTSELSHDSTGYYISYKESSYDLSYHKYRFPSGVQETQEYTENGVSKTRLLYNQIRTTDELYSALGSSDYSDHIKYLPLTNGEVTFQVWDKQMNLDTTNSIFLFSDLKFKDSNSITFNTNSVKAKLESLITDDHEWDNIGLMFVNCEFEMNNGTNVDLFRTADYIKHIYFNISRFTKFEAQAGGHLFQNDDNLVTFLAQDEWYKNTIIRDANGTNSFGPTVKHFFNGCDNLTTMRLSKEEYTVHQDSLDDVTDYSYFLANTPNLSSLAFYINKPNVKIDHMCDGCGKDNEEWDNYRLIIYEDATISSASHAFNNMETLTENAIYGKLNVTGSGNNCDYLFANNKALRFLQFEAWRSAGVMASTSGRNISVKRSPPAPFGSGKLPMA